jgi:hypothetical protein
LSVIIQGKSADGLPASDGFESALAERRRSPRAGLQAMKKVYSSDSFFLVGHLRDLLENHHIKCIAKNEFLLGGAGELPPTECWPELWIAEDFQYQKARELIEGFLASNAEPGSEWHCARCGECIEGQFSACWRCGVERPYRLD